MPYLVEHKRSEDGEASAERPLSGELVAKLEVSTERTALSLARQLADGDRETYCIVRRKNGGGLVAQVWHDSESGALRVEDFKIKKPKPITERPENVPEHLWTMPRIENDYRPHDKEDAVRVPERLTFFKAEQKKRSRRHYRTWKITYRSLTSAESTEIHLWQTDDDGELLPLDQQDWKWASSYLGTAVFRSPDEAWDLAIRNRRENLRLAEQRVKNEKKMIAVLEKARAAAPEMVRPTADSAVQ